jgi:glycosyltransferase involved in cell wall biosynthesis
MAIKSSESFDILIKNMSIERQEIKVSIVISAYNYGSYVKKAIDSALAQDYQEGFEVIVINDASTDDTDQTCKRYKNSITYLRNEKNMGYPATVNRGIHIAKGDYICILDADDTLFSDALSWYAKTLDNFPFIGFVYGDIVRANELKGTRNRHKSPDFNRRDLELRNIVYASSQMFRKECIEAVNGYDERLAYAVDWDLWLRMSEKFCALHIPKLIGERSLKEAGMAAEAKRQRTYEKCRNTVFKRLKRRKLLNSIKKIFYGSAVKGAEQQLEQAKAKQALNQCDFILGEISPRKVLVAQGSEGYLSSAFSAKGVNTVRADKEDLVKTIRQGSTFDLMVFWNILETFDEVQAQKIIGQILMFKPENVVLLLETAEFYEGAYDMPTKPLAGWLGQFSQDYKVVEPKQIRPQLDADNWFYNYGLDKAIFLKKY